MARFYASIQGNRGEATRMGSTESGIEGHIRGWDIGCRASVEAGRENKDEDILTVTITSGSGGHGESLFVGRFVKREGKIVKLEGRYGE